MLVYACFVEACVQEVGMPVYAPALEQLQTQDGAPGASASSSLNGNGNKEHITKKIDQYSLIEQSYFLIEQSHTLVHIVYIEFCVLAEPEIQLDIRQFL